jgi:hypothetical protein
VHTRIALLPVLVNLVACPQPPPEAPTDPTAGEQPAPATGPADGPADVPAAPNPDGSTPPAPAGFGAATGEKVTVSGTLAYAGKHEGVLHLEFWRQLDDGSCEALDSRVVEFGAWSVEVPVDSSGLVVAAYLDVAEDGTPIDDPRVMWPNVVEVGKAPVSGIDLALSKNQEMQKPLCGAPGAAVPP